MIAGGGPAGLSCGIRLRELGWDVVVHERRRYPLRKVCGEFLSPAGWARLERLGVCEHVHLKPGSIVRARFELTPGVATEFALDPAARGLSRAAMDAALASRFRALGGELLEDSTWTDSVQSGEAFVDARGRPSEPGRGHSWHGWNGYIDPVHIPGGYDPGLLQMLPVDGGYCGMSIVESGLLGISFVSDREAPPRAILRSHPYLAPIADVIVPHAAIAGFRFRTHRAPGRIGDRLRVWPPLVGDGMSRALGAGIAEAERLALGRKHPAPRVWDFTMALALHAAMCSPALRRWGCFLPFRRRLLAGVYRITRG